MSARIRSIAGQGAEVSFAILPLLVVGIVLIHQGPLLNLFASPEWSFGAAILFGQALVKFVTGFARSRRVSTGIFALAVALLIVFGLVPALVVNAMTVIATEAAIKGPDRGLSIAASEATHPLGVQTSTKREGPTPGLQISQVLLFGAGVLTYLLLGTVAEEASKAYSQDERARSDIESDDRWDGVLPKRSRRYTEP